jgi:hypothetical protein
MGPRGFRRRGRRRGLIVGAAVGASVARSRANSQDANDQYSDDQAVQDPAPESIEQQLSELQDIKAKGLITDADFETKKKQILGI